MENEGFEPPDLLQSIVFSEGIPLGSEGIPLGSEGIPLGSEGIPLGPEGIPLGQDYRNRPLCQFSVSKGNRINIFLRKTPLYLQ